MPTSIVLFLSLPDWVFHGWSFGIGWCMPHQRSNSPVPLYCKAGEKVTLRTIRPKHWGNRSAKEAQNGVSTITACCGSRQQPHQIGVSSKVWVIIFNSLQEKRHFSTQISNPRQVPFCVLIGDYTALWLQLDFRIIMHWGILFPKDSVPAPHPKINWLTVYTTTSHSALFWNILL